MIQDLPTGKSTRDRRLRATVAGASGDLAAELNRTPPRSEALEGGATS
jgi:hypothetical protein